MFHYILLLVLLKFCVNLLSWFLLTQSRCCFKQTHKVKQLHHDSYYNVTVMVNNIRTLKISWGKWCWPDGSLLLVRNEEFHCYGIAAMLILFRYYWPMRFWSSSCFLCSVYWFNRLENLGRKEKKSLIC